MLSISLHILSEASEIIASSPLESSATSSFGSEMSNALFSPVIKRIIGSEREAHIASAQTNEICFLILSLSGESIEIIAAHTDTLITAKSSSFIIKH